MAVTRKRKQRAKPLDLARRAGLLGVTAGHLSQVLSGKRESRRLLVKYSELIKTESCSKPTTKKQHEIK